MFKCAGAGCREWNRANRLLAPGFSVLSQRSDDKIARRWRGSDPPSSSRRTAAHRSSVSRSLGVKVNGGIGRPVRIGVLPSIERTSEAYNLFHDLPRQDTSIATHALSIVSVLAISGARVESVPSTRLEYRVAFRGIPERVSRPGGRGSPGRACPTAPLGPCRSRARPVDYPVRGACGTQMTRTKRQGPPGPAAGAVLRQRPAGAAIRAWPSADRRGDQRVRESPATSMQRGAAIGGEATVP
jgi:hypothetical protein